MKAMAAILLTWNPDSKHDSPTKWDWDEMAAHVIRAQNEGGFGDNWRCRARANVGARGFLLKQGPEPCGIFGRGEVVDEWYREPTGLRRGTARAPVLITEMVLPIDGNIVDRYRLRDVLTDREWNTRASGIKIPDEMAASLEEAWSPVARQLQRYKKDYAGHDVPTLTKRRVDHEHFSYTVKRNYHYRCAVPSVSTRLVGACT
jgi:hypothetical protein